MRLAFVDLLFCWPPLGGADVDLYHVIVHLQHLGHDVRLFGLREEGAWDRGAFAPEEMPFPAERLDFPPRRFTRANIARTLRAAVDRWRPEAVVVADGFFLKPYVIDALAHHPLAARYYAYEMACHRDILRYKLGAPCPNAYLATPEVCRRCAFDHLAPALRAHSRLAWHREYGLAAAYGPHYHAALRRALRRTRVGVVSNAIMAALLAPDCAETVIVPGGVNADFHAAAPPPPPRAIKRIVMTGRGEDPAKGANILRGACERLRERRTDFEVRITAPEDEAASDWWRPVGWQDAAGMRALYRDADLCVVPSTWDEPFGLVALEAMATARPVCASRVGGLQDLVVNRETGFLFPRDDMDELAAAINVLLDNPELRARMGAAGRRRVEAHYTWRRVIEQHYVPLIERLARSAAP